MLAYEELAAAAAPKPAGPPASLPYFKICQMSGLTAIIDYDVSIAWDAG
jgi:hypothetical protein